MANYLRREGVERYPNGRIKYERDYKKAYQQRKENGRWAKLAIDVKIDVLKAFDEKLEEEGVGRGTKIKEWMIDYIDGKLR